MRWRYNGDSMSTERQIVQEELVRWLLTWTTAPYGVIQSISPFGEGKVRKITFGLARVLDAELTILSKNNLSLYSNYGKIKFNSVDEFKNYCHKQWGIKDV